MPNLENTVQVAAQRAGESSLDTYERTLRQLIWERRSLARIQSPDNKCWS